MLEAVVVSLQKTLDNLRQQIIPYQVKFCVEMFFLWGPFAPILFFVTTVLASFCCSGCFVSIIKDVFSFLQHVFRCWFVSDLKLELAL